MLVLSRKAGEEIVLPTHGVTIGVVSLDSNSVRLGITAPPQVPVRRPERRTKPSEAAAGKPGANGNHSELRKLVERRIRLRTGDRIRALQVKSVAGQVLVEGYSRSNYDRQLAYSAAMEVLNASKMDPPVKMEVLIEVRKPR